MRLESSQTRAGMLACFGFWLENFHVLVLLTDSLVCRVYATSKPFALYIPALKRLGQGVFAPPCWFLKLQAFSSRPWFGSAQVVSVGGTKWMLKWRPLLAISIPKISPPENSSAAMGIIPVLSIMSSVCFSICNVLSLCAQKKKK